MPTTTRVTSCQQSCQTYACVPCTDPGPLQQSCNMPQFPSYLPLIVAASALTVALVTDLRGLWIPNLLTFPLLLSGIAYQAGSPQGQGLIFGLLGLFVATTPFLLMYSLNAMGAGDVKLVAGLGMWLGPLLAINGVLLALIAHSVYSLSMLAASGRLRRSWDFLLRRSSVADLVEPSPENRSVITRIPFSPGIAIGFLVAFIFCPLT